MLVVALPERNLAQEVVGLESGVRVRNQERFRHSDGFGTQPSFSVTDIKADKTPSPIRRLVKVERSWPPGLECSTIHFLARRMISFKVASGRFALQLELSTCTANNKASSGVPNHAQGASAGTVRYCASSEWFARWPDLSFQPGDM
jgi:hypothetical protein